MNGTSRASAGSLGKTVTAVVALGVAGIVIFAFASATALSGGSMSLNNGASYVTTTTVTIGSSYADATEMRLMPPIRTADSGPLWVSAVATDGTLWAWGQGASGQCGSLTDSMYQANPYRLSAASDWTTVSAGYAAGYALKADGSLWSWGGNWYGQLGAGNKVNTAAPAQVLPGSTWVAVSAGSQHVAAIKTDGTLWAWGNNAKGQIGSGASTESSVPVQLSAGTFKSVSCGGDNTFAVRSDGALFAWGDNQYGQLANGTTDYSVHSSPNQVTGATFTRVFAGGYGTVAAMDAAGGVWMWGRNNEGECGTGSTTPGSVVSATKVNGLPVMADLDIGTYHTLARATDGSVWVWGYNGYSQLGLGDTTMRTSPVALMPGRSFDQVLAGDIVSFVRVGTTLMACGYPGYQQYGDGTDVQRSSFTTIGAGWEPYSASRTARLAASDGTQTVSVMYRDEAGAVAVLTDSIYYDGTAPSGTLSINGGETYTTTATVTLCSAVSGAAYMRVDGGAWVPFNSTTVHTLSSADGLKTVSVDYSDEASNTLSLTGSITLDTQAPAGTMSLNGNAPSTRFRTVRAGSTFTDAVAMRIGGLADIVSASPGANGMLVLRSDGTLWGTGSNSAGQVGNGWLYDNKTGLSQTYGGATWRSASMGGNSSIGVRTDGTLWTWGDNSYGQLGQGNTVMRPSPTRVGAESTWTTAVAGSSSAFALKSDGSLWGTGYNSSGQLGNKNTTAQYSFVRCGSATDYFTRVAVGSSHVLALKADGSLWAWGDNGSGQLGDGSTVSTSTPKLVSAGPWSAIAAGGSASAAIKPNGTLWTWGSPSGLGDGSSVSRKTPAMVGSDTWKGISSNAGSSAFNGVKSDGTLWAWGSNFYGQLGDYSKTDRPVMVRIGTRSDWQWASMGQASAAGRTADGTFWAWGIGGYLANGTTREMLHPAPSDLQPYDAAYSHQLSSGDGAKSLTIDYFDAAGNSTRVTDTIQLDSTAPAGTLTLAGGADYVTSVTGMPWASSVTWAESMRLTAAAVSVSAGSTHSMLVGSDTVLWGTGGNLKGQQGNNTSGGTYTKPFVTGGSRGWAKVWAGNEVTHLLKTDGTLYATGQSPYGLLGIGGTSQVNTPTLVGTNFSVVSEGTQMVSALKTDGSLWVWGRNQYGELGRATGVTQSLVPTSVPGTWVSTASGGYHMLGVKSDGTLWSWGRNNTGQLGIGTADAAAHPTVTQVPSSGTGWSAVAAGTDFSLALKSDGSLYSWGNGANMALGTGNTTSVYTPTLIGTGFSTVSAGGDTVLAIKSDGTLWGWGSNGYGQLGDGTTFNRHVPSIVSSYTDWVSCDPGQTHCIAVRSDGTVWVAGGNTSGQLGDNSISTRSVWQQMAQVAWTGPASTGVTTPPYVTGGPVTVCAQFRDTAGNVVNLSDSVALDNTPPSTTASGAPAGWVTGPVSVSLAATDDYSGVALTRFAINGAAAQTYTGAIPVTAEGTTTITFRSTDGAGNQETTKTVQVRRDTTAPVTSSDVGEGWRGSDRVTLASADGGSGVLGIRYQVDSGAVATYTVPFSVPEGTSTLRYWAVDNAGNSETTVTATARVDLGMPISTCSSLPVGWVNAPVRVTLSGSDSGSGLLAVRYRLDGVVSTYTAPFDISDGDHTFEYWAVDNAGNAETAHSATVKVDSGPPVTTSNITGWWQADSEVTLYPTDAGSGILVTYYQIGAGDVAVYTGPFALPEGVSTVKYWSVDNSGYTEVINSATAMFDTSMPQVSIAPSTAGELFGWYPHEVTATICASDTGAGMDTLEYRINGGPVQAYTEPLPFGNGVWSLQVFARDKSGKTTVLSDGYQIDTVAPVTTATVPTGWKPARTVTLAAADGGGSGVAHTYYRLNGGEATAYAGPFSVPEGETAIEYWSEDAVGHVEAARTATAQVDLEPPATTASGFTPGAWSTVPVSVTLVAHDDAPGIDHVGYVVDGGTLQSYVAPILFDVDGVHTLEFAAVDRAGRKEETQTVQIKLDFAAPVTVDDAVAGWHGDARTVTLTSSDAGSGVSWTQYRINGGSFQPYLGPIAVAAEGDTLIEYRSADLAGNVAALGSAHVKYDATAPVTTASGVPSGASHAPADVVLSASDALSGVGATWYRIAGGPALPYVAPIHVAEIGTTRIDYWSVDAAGNVESEKSATVTIDFGMLELAGGTGWSRSADVTASTYAPTAVQMRTYSPWNSLSAGEDVSLVSDGRLNAKGFGANSSGELEYAMQSPYPDSANPVRVGPMGAISSVSAGSGFVAAVGTDGNLYTWGANDHGQLARGASGSPERGWGYVGMQVWGVPWTQASAGHDHLLAIMANGELWGAGSNAFGQLGREGGDTSYITRISSGWRSVTAGSYHSVAIRNDGTLWAWGSNGHGQLGLGSTEGTSVPVQVGSDNDWLAASAGADYTLALKSDGSLWAWGLNDAGQLGCAAGPDRLTPARVGFATYRSASAGSRFALAIASDGSLWSWGDNASGQLGIGSNDPVTAPTQVGTSTEWEMVDAGSDHAMGALRDATLFTWGANDRGQLGNGTTTPVNVPTEIMHVDWQPFAAETVIHLGDLPLYASSPGPVYVEYKDASDNVVFLSDTIGFDFQLPQIGLNSPAIPDGSWFNAPQTYSYYSGESAAESGIAAAYYGVNGAAVTPIPYAGTITVADEGVNTLRMAVIDVAGNRSDLFSYYYSLNPNYWRYGQSTATIRIDYTPPTTKSDANVSGWQNRAVWRLNATDALSGIGGTVAAVDGASLDTYTGPITLAEGIHTLEYRSSDRAGNTEPTRSETVRVDLTDPVSAASGVPAGWTGSDVVVSLSGTDSAAGLDGVRYRIDGGAVETYTAAIAMPEGEHVLERAAVDAAGNVEDWQPLVVRIDKTAPETVAGYAGQWSPGPVTVPFTATDELSGVASTRYRVNGGAETVGSSVTVASEGVTDVEYWSVDECGNAEQPHLVQVRIDKTAPATTIDGVPSDVATAEVGVTLAADDAASGVRTTYYRLDGGTTKVYVAGQSRILVAKEGTTTVEYWSVDGVGNTEAVTSALVRIDYEDFLDAGTKNPSCLGCHSAPTGPRRVRMDFRAGTVDRAQACPKCHPAGLVGTHPYHNGGGNCGAVCHPGWGASLASAIPGVSTSYGAFAAASSKDVGSEVLHSIHSQPRWAATADAAFSRCASCHAAAACSACHDASSKPVEPRHAVHSASGDSFYPAQPAWNGTVSPGVAFGDQTQLTATTVTQQCTTAQCHNTDSLRATDPVRREDFSHAADPAAGIAENVVTKTGTWKDKYLASETGGRASLSTQANATHVISFVGQKVAFIGETGNNYGKADIYIDDVFKATVDEYSATTKYQVQLFESEVLTPGTHSIKVRVRGDRNAASRGSQVIVDAYKVWTSMPGTVAPFCTQCHADRVADHGYADYDHVADLGATVEPRSGATCVSCHSMDLLTEHERVGSSSKDRRCANCHAAPRQTFTTWAQGCVQAGCHSPGTVEEQHAQIDPRHTEKAADVVDCARNCHKQDLPAEHARAEHADPVTCVECHGSAAFDALRSGGWDKRCTACHAVAHVAAGTTGNTLCLDCHGASPAAITASSGSAAYGATGGDHATGFAASAHGPARVVAGNNDGVQTGASCEVCHDKRDASGVQGITAFRTAGDARAGSSLCFSCHSASGEETRSPGVRPYTWNGRDVESEFSRASSHEGVACASCHNTHVVGTGASSAWDLTRVSDPRNTKQPFTGTSTSFCLTCHSASEIRPSWTAGSVVPYAVDFPAAASAALFTGWAKDAPGVDFVGSGHFTTTGTKALCENCHDPHGSERSSLLAWTRPSGFTSGTAGQRDNTSLAAHEERLCLQCHGDGATGFNAPGAQIVTQTVDSLYGHDTGASASHSDTESVVQIAARRHVECVDCHDVHAARPGLHVAGTSEAAPALRGAVGVEPAWSGGAWTTADSYGVRRITGAAGDAEAFVCLKCHTAAAGRPATVTRSNGTTYTSTDLATEFNPANPSYHNVFGLPTGMRQSFNIAGLSFTWYINDADAMFRPGWDQNSPVACSDCHTGGAGAAGPHGSSVKWSIDPAYPGDYEKAGMDLTSPDFVSEKIICLKCHDFTKGMNNVHTATSMWGGTTGVHSRQHDRDVSCVSCHVRVPHGWKRPRMLGYTTDPEPYRAGVWADGVPDYSNTWKYRGVNAVRARTNSQHSWNFQDCQANCTSMHYNPGVTGPYLP